MLSNGFMSEMRIVYILSWCNISYDANVVVLWVTRYMYAICVAHVLGVGASMRG